jgi:arabinogalactan oligomer / maltooligosaccharide transport system permease protein
VATASDVTRAKRSLPAASASLSRRRASALEMTLIYLILIAAVFFALFPVWFLFTASIRPGQTLFSTNLATAIFPTDTTLGNYQYMLTRTDFVVWIRNSFYIAVLTTIATLFIATPAAYAFSRFRFPGRSNLLLLFLALQSFPAVMALVPLYLLLQRLGLLNHAGLILAYSAGALVFNIWNMKGYFDTIPIDLGEAALIDGASPTEAFLRVVLPLARPVLAITALFSFLAGWNEYIMAQTILNSSAEYTAPVGLFILQNDKSVPWGYFAAGSLMVSVPVMILFLSLQRNLVSGLTAGGSKG